jgi:hypothetical protein
VQPAALGQRFQLAGHLGQRLTAAQRQWHRFAEPDGAVLLAQPQQHHLAAVDPPAGGYVWPPERQRVGDDLGGRDPHAEISSPAATSTL